MNRCFLVACLLLAGCLPAIQPQPITPPALPDAGVKLYAREAAAAYFKAADAVPHKDCDIDALHEQLHRDIVAARVTAYAPLDVRLEAVLGVPIDQLDRQRAADELRAIGNEFQRASAP